MAIKYSRREFLQNTTAASAGLVLGATAFSARSYARIAGANDRINFAVIGLHGRGGEHISSIAACKNALVTHICDVDKREIDRGTAMVKAASGQTPVPDYLDWQLWQGPAPRRPYKDNIHPYNWHWFWHWGTGETLNNGTHEVDVCLWALGLKGYPNKVTAAGGRYHFNDDWEFYDTLVASFEYENGLITWEGKSCNGKKYYGRGRGVTIHGTKGTVLIDRNSYHIEVKGQGTYTFEKSDRDASTNIRGGGPMTNAHFQNFIDAIRSGKKLHSPIEEGNISVTMLQLSNIAWKVGQTLHLDPTNAHILNNKEAGALWNREYEPGWELRI